jgi:hypothetical protein
MAQNEPEMHETKRHHFLFHIFRMDKAENPMPQNQAERLLHYLKSVFMDNTKNEKGRK